MHTIRTGAGTPLLLVHGLGGSGASWDPILPSLAAEREIVAVDLPGFGRTPPLPGRPTFAGLVDALERHLGDEGLDGVDAVGSSMGARIVLELARRRAVGAVVALDPGGFWNARERAVFGASVRASYKLVEGLRPALPALTGNPVTRSLLFAQFSARPWALDGRTALAELNSFHDSAAFEETLDALVESPEQEGMEDPPRGPIVIGWGRRDLVTLPRQAARAQRRFPYARVHWFERCGHFPHWDRPEETVRLVLEATG